MLLQFSHANIGKDEQIHGCEVGAKDGIYHFNSFHAVPNHRGVIDREGVGIIGAVVENSLAVFGHADCRLAKQATVTKKNCYGTRRLHLKFNCRFALSLASLLIAAAAKCCSSGLSFFIRGISSSSIRFTICPRTSA